TAPTPPSAAGSPLGAAGDRVVMRLLEKDPAGRYRSVAEVKRALRALLQDQGRGPEPPGPAEPPPLSPPPSGGGVGPPGPGPGPGSQKPAPPPPPPRADVVRKTAPELPRTEVRAGGGGSA